MKWGDGLRRVTTSHREQYKIIPSTQGKRVERKIMTVKKESATMTNRVELDGVVTFVKSYGKVTNIGLLTTYVDNGKSFKTSNVVKCFEDVSNIVNKCDTISIVGHFSSSKFTDKYGNERFDTQIIVDELK